MLILYVWPVVDVQRAVAADVFDAVGMLFVFAAGLDAVAKDFALNIALAADL